MKYNRIDKLMALVVVLISCCNIPAQNPNNALNFDNIDDQVVVPDASVLIANSSAMSMTLWVNPSNPAIVWPDYDGFAGFRDNAYADFYLIRHVTTLVEGRFRNASGTDFTVIDSTIQPGIWQHYALVYDGTYLSMYRNGSLVAGIEANGVITSTAEDFLIGNLPYFGNQFYMMGDIDEVALWNRALSPGEVFCIYKSEVTLTSPGLQLYYRFDQGSAGGSNTGITSLTDATGHINGTMMNLALSGSISNFVTGAPYATELTASICPGQSYSFGGVSLSMPGYYSLSVTGSTGCDSILHLNLSLISLNTNVSLTGITLTAAQTGASYQWLNCNTGFSVIPGAMGQSFTPTANGNYAVIVTFNGCADTSACVPVTTVGIPDHVEPDDMILKPNPANDVLFIDPGETGSRVFYSISELSGKKVMSGYLDGSNSLKVNISSLDKGIYLVKIGLNGKTFRRKLLKY